MSREEGKQMTNEEKASGDEETAEGEDPTYVQRQIDAAYSAGKDHGRSEAWAEAIHLVKNAAASEYISGGDNGAARILRQLCLDMVSVHQVRVK